MASDYQNDSEVRRTVDQPHLRLPCPSPADTSGLLADQVALGKLPQSTRTTIGG
jgi:hypothetical protein